MENKNVEIQLGILNIKDLGFFVNEAITHHEENQINYNISFSHDYNKDTIELIFKADYVTVPEGVIYISGSCSTIFFIKDLNQFKNKENLDLPTDIFSTLFSIAFTHTRAILSKNLAGSVFSHVHLPLIKPAEMVKTLFKKSTSV